MKNEFQDIRTLIDAITLVKESKIKEYEQVGIVAVNSLKALLAIQRYCPKGKLSSCPFKVDMPK